jgi:hypothetical protein
VFQPRKRFATGDAYRHLRRSRRNFRDAPNPGPASSIEESARHDIETEVPCSRSRMRRRLRPRFANVARAEDAPKPDAMSGDHMAPMKKPHMKKHMMKEGGHMMAPEAPK